MVNHVKELTVWFESAAIAYGYAHDTARAKWADDILADLNKIVTRAKELGLETERRLVDLMTDGQTPWVRFCSAMLMTESDPDRAISTLRQLSKEQGMFVPMCVALLSDLEEARARKH